MPKTKCGNPLYVEILQEEYDRQFALQASSPLEYPKLVLKRQSAEIQTVTGPRT